MPETNYDVAIVGAGFSGPILAARIAQKGVNPRNGERLKVALVEEGPYLKGYPRPGYGIPLRRRMFTNLPAGFPYFHRADRSAKLVGGSSVHWDGQAFLPFPMDYVHWEKETGVDWTEENLSAAVAEIRDMFSIHRFPDEIDTRGNRLFNRVARRMGYDARRQEAARRNCIYCGFCTSPIMCKYDSRASTLTTYIPIAERHGVDIIPDTRVEKILIEVRSGRGVALGFLCRGPESTYELTADKVILCCGYRATPRLLMTSGYGPDQWKGNPILVRNDNIGQHIDGHPRTPGVTALFDDPLGDGDLGSIGGHYLIHDDRPDGEGRLLFRASFGVGRNPVTDSMNPFAPLYGRAHKGFMRDKRILHTVSHRPSVSKGSGRWSFNSDGEILYGGDHSLTIRRAREGMEIARDVLKEMGPREMTSIDVPVGFTPRTSGSHRVGSCRAGVDPKNSVVNPYFESHDVENLLICDASVIPRVTTGNSGTPQASVTAFAAGRMIERHFS